MTEPAADVVFLGEGVVGLDVVADEVFVKGRILREVVGRGSGNILRRSQVRLGISCKGIQLLENTHSYRANPGIVQGNLVVGKRSTTGAASGRRGSCPIAIGCYTRIRIIDLTAVATQVEYAAGDVVERNVRVH